MVGRVGVSTRVAWYRKAWRDASRGGFQATLAYLSLHTIVLKNMCCSGQSVRAAVMSGRDRSLSNDSSRCQCHWEGAQRRDGLSRTVSQR